MCPSVSKKFSRADYAAIPAKCIPNDAFLRGSRIFVVGYTNAGTAIKESTVLNSGSIILKSLAIAAVAGLAVFGIFYGFFISHRELGIEPSSARWAGIV